MTDVPAHITGRNRRLWHEWQTLQEALAGRKDIRCSVLRTNAEGLPTRYRIDYHIRSLSGVTEQERLGEPGVSNLPLYADLFLMVIDLPDSYPCVDGAPVFRFLTEDEQHKPIPHPWHPNIRYFGSMAGRVCLNQADTYTDLLWGVRRIASYLRYECYHAVNEPPYPEDQQVAAWVIRQAEPNGWI